VASNPNSNGSGFLFGSSLAGANGFLKSHDAYLGSAPRDRGARELSDEATIITHLLVVKLICFKSQQMSHSVK